MDVVMIHPKKNKVALLGKKNKLSDSIVELDTKNAVGFKQEGMNKLSVMGTTFVTPYILIQSHGDITCTKSECLSRVPDASFVPSRKAVQGTELARRIMNTFISSHEGFLEPDELKKEEKRFVPLTMKNVKNVKIDHGKKGFSVRASGHDITVDQFLIDPVVIDSFKINKKEASIDMQLNGAECAFRKDFMSTPARTVLFCSTSTGTRDAYNLKMFFSTYKEQLQSARSMQLKSTGDRILSCHPECRTVGGIICCRDGDEDEICY